MLQARPPAAELAGGVRRLLDDRPAAARLARRARRAVEVPAQALAARDHGRGLAARPGPSGGCGAPAGRHPAARRRELRRAPARAVHRDRGASRCSGGADRALARRGRRSLASFDGGLRALDRRRPRRRGLAPRPRPRRPARARASALAHGRARGSRRPRGRRRSEPAGPGPAGRPEPDRGLAAPRSPSRVGGRGAGGLQRRSRPAAGARRARDPLRRRSAAARRPRAGPAVGALAPRRRLPGAGRPR